MSIFFKHFFGSLERVMEKHPEMYWQEQDKIEHLLWELHKWFDEYFGKAGTDEDGEYDFTNPRYFRRHRIKRHHFEGICKAVDFFSSPDRYGKRFKEIIRQEAEKHVIDDMGEVLFQDECYRKICWRRHGD